MNNQVNQERHRDSRIHCDTRAEDTAEKKVEGAVATGVVAIVVQSGRCGNRLQ